MEDLQRLSMSKEAKVEERAILEEILVWKSHHLLKFALTQHDMKYQSGRVYYIHLWNCQGLYSMMSDWSIILIIEGDCMITAASQTIKMKVKKKICVYKDIYLLFENNGLHILVIYRK